jgi:hemolysin activation/secretion protein
MISIPLVPRRPVSLAVLTFLFAGTGSLEAWSADAGSEIRRYQSETQQRLRKPPGKETPIADMPSSRSQAAAKASDAAIWVTGFHVQGVTLFSEAEVAEVLRPFVDRSLKTADIHAAADTLKRHYRNAGYFAAKVFIPPQTLSNVVELEVYEGFLEADGLELLNKSTRMRDEAYQAILEENIDLSQPMHRDEFERALLLAADLPGGHTSAVLYPGREVGTARLRAVVSDAPFFAGNLDIDNYGSKSLGQTRLGTTLYLNSPGGVGDQVVTRLVTSGQASNYAYLTYLRPVSGAGTRLGASLDYFRYATDELQGVGEADGYASDARLYATYPITRARFHNLNLRADVSRLRLADRNDLKINAERRIDTAVFAIFGDETNHWLPGGLSVYDAILTLGNVEITGNALYQTSDSVYAQTEGAFARVNFSAQRLQSLAGPYSLFAKMSGQWASDNLDSSQKFYLGGGTSVSGYPLGEVGGDMGLEVNLELRREFVPPWGGYLHGSLFYQQGWAKQHKSPWTGWQGNYIGLDNTVSLRTLGLGATQSWASTWVLRGLIGWQVGSNPLEDPRTGEDSDGDSDDFRAWFQVLRYF